MPPRPIELAQRRKVSHRARAPDAASDSPDTRKLSRRTRSSSNLSTRIGTYLIARASARAILKWVRRRRNLSSPHPAPHRTKRIAPRAHTLSRPPSTS
jgi:hypothetical protein